MASRQHHEARRTHHHHFQAQMRSRILRGVSDFSKNRRLKKTCGKTIGDLRQIVSFR